MAVWPLVPAYYSSLCSPPSPDKGLCNSAHQISRIPFSTLWLGFGNCFGQQNVAAVTAGQSQAQASDGSSVPPWPLYLYRCCGKNTAAWPRGGQETGGAEPPGWVPAGVAKTLLTPPPMSTDTREIISGCCFKSLNLRLSCYVIKSYPIHPSTGCKQ